MIIDLKNNHINNNKNKNNNQEIYIIHLLMKSHMNNIILNVMNVI